MISTNWIVITGPPCSGKTTVINHLLGMNYKVVPDISRVYIQRELSSGKTAEQIHDNWGNAQQCIVQMRSNILDSLAPDDIVFHDYAMPCNIAFRKLYDLKDTGELHDMSSLFVYKHIFLLDYYTMQYDSVRSIDSISQSQLSDELYNVYSNLGYNVNIDPKMAVSDRANKILNIAELI